MQRVTKKNRVSVSFEAESYAVIEEISNKKKVSLAWVVRDAVEQYLLRELPMIHDSEHLQSQRIGSDESKK